MAQPPRAATTSDPMVISKTLRSTAQADGCQHACTAAAMTGARAASTTRSGGVLVAVHAPGSAGRRSPGSVMASL